MDAGIVPVKRLLVREMTLSFFRDPSSEGILPVTMPANRTSWLNSVRLAIKGDNVPANPGEPDRPVPRTSDSTRLGCSEDEQVTPAKDEQGSPEAKSQLEKKCGEETA